MNDTAAIQERLEQLRQEQERGQRMLADLENEVAELRNQLLRIAGAIQVLEELQANEEDLPAD